MAPVAPELRLSRGLGEARYGGECAAGPRRVRGSSQPTVLSGALRLQIRLDPLLSETK